MQALIAFIAALTVTDYCIRGEDSFSLAVMAGIAWA
ncbi:MAG: hypothetical protein QOD99_1619, partial [Chthoniobacter sp.]|nr:hypothetical protein [Chthoniobacter sp.]